MERCLLVYRSSWIIFRLIIDQSSPLRRCLLDGSGSTSRNHNGRRTVLVDGHNHLGRLAYVDRLTEALHDRLQFRRRDVAVAVFVKQSKRILQHCTTTPHFHQQLVFVSPTQPVRTARQS